MPDIHDTLRRDAVLRRLIDAHGPLTLTPAEDPFARLVGSIIGQQLSTQAARTIRTRVAATVPLTPAALLDADEADLRSLGLSRQKVRYVKNVARHFDAHNWSRASFAPLDDAAVIDRLTTIQGVGVWTAKMFLMFALARPDVLPVEDLGIRRAFARFYDAETPDAMGAAAEPWRPHRSTACLYLWRGYDAAGEAPA